MKLHPSSTNHSIELETADTCFITTSKKKPLRFTKQTYGGVGEEKTFNTIEFTIPAEYDHIQITKTSIETKITVYNV